MSEEQKAIEKLKEISFMTGYKQALDVAIKALRIVDVIENGFKRDSNLMMDSDDWNDIKEFIEKKEAENEHT